MTSAWWWMAFWAAFAVMELAAWGAHRYVMHGWLWSLHADHHQPTHRGPLQRNDAFALFFALPSAAFIVLGSLRELPALTGSGFGIMAYGLVYFLVHEVIIHRRLRLLPVPRHWYFEALNAAHKHHHAVRTREGCRNFGMLLVPPSYFVAARRRALERHVTRGAAPSPPGAERRRGG